MDWIFNLEEQINRICEIQREIERIRCSEDVCINFDELTLENVQYNFRQIDYRVYDSMSKIVGSLIQIAGILEETGKGTIDMANEICTRMYIQEQVIRELIKNSPDSAAMLLTGPNSVMREYVQKVLKENE